VGVYLAIEVNNSRMVGKMLGVGIIG
jgi:hypothetical protein